MYVLSFFACFSSFNFITYFVEEIPYDQYQTAYHAGYYEQDPVASQYEGEDNVLNFLSNYAVTEKQSFDDVSI